MFTTNKLVSWVRAKPSGENVKLRRHIRRARLRSQPVFPSIGPRKDGDWRVLPPTGFLSDDLFRFNNFLKTCLELFPEYR